LIAGGIGITPLRALAEQIGGNAVLIYRVFRDEEIVFRSELDSLAREKGLTVFYVVGDHRDPGAKQLLSPRHLLELVPDLPTRDVFLCGPLAMMDAVSANLLEAGVTRATLYTERFAL
jgi:ferredoxin-NADP reductase